MSTNPLNSSDRDEQLNEVLADYLRAVDAGRPPNREELLARYPHLASELAAFFANRDQMERLAGVFRSLARSAAQPSPGAAPPGMSGALPAAQGPLGKVHYFGDYELLHEIARGGMGVVYKARQVSLNRIVA